MPATKVLTQEPSTSSLADDCKCGDPGCVGHAIIPTETSRGTEHLVELPGFTSRKVRDCSNREIIVFDEAIPLVCAQECDLAVSWNPHSTQLPYHWVLRE